MFFTADTHFGHYNCISHCNRPYKDLVEMDENLISNWNKIIKPKDIVYHLGDFCWKDPELYFNRLNGQIHLILGNHDHSFKYHKRNLFKSINDYKLIHIGQVGIVLCHYAMRVWHKSHYGYMMLYGHSHGLLPEIQNSFDIGVDCWNYTPIHIDQILEKRIELDLRGVRP